MVYKVSNPYILHILIHLMFFKKLALLAYHSFIIKESEIKKRLYLNTMLIKSDKFDTLEDKELLNYALNNATLID